MSEPGGRGAAWTEERGPSDEGRRRGEGGMGRRAGPRRPAGDTGTRSRIGSWPVYRQLTGTDRRGLGAAAKSDHPRVARTSTADAVVKSVCPYCAVGCGQNVYVSGDKVIQIEGDPDSPVSRGR